MIITEMNRTNVERISADVNRALNAIAEKYGCKLETRGGSYNEKNGSFKPSVEFVCEDSSGIPKSFSANCDRYALTVDDFGKEFTDHSGTYSICGLQLRARKTPILAKSKKNGKTYKFSVKFVSQALGKDLEAHYATRGKSGISDSEFQKLVNS